VSGDQRISNGAWFVPDTTPEVTSTVRAVADGEGFNHDCGRSYGSLLHTFRMKWKCSFDRRLPAALEPEIYTPGHMVLTVSSSDNALRFGRSRLPISAKEQM